MKPILTSSLLTLALVTGLTGCSSVMPTGLKPLHGLSPAMGFNVSGFNGGRLTVKIPNLRGLLAAQAPAGQRALLYSLGDLTSLKIEVFEGTSESDADLANLVDSTDVTSSEFTPVAPPTPDAWDTLNTYAKGDVVDYNGQYFVARGPISSGGNAPDNDFLNWDGYSSIGDLPGVSNDYTWVGNMSLGGDYYVRATAFDSNSGQANPSLDGWGNEIGSAGAAVTIDAAHPRPTVELNLQLTDDLPGGGGLNVHLTVTNGNP